MNTLLNYLIEASIGLVLFYAVYYFLLRKETNFHFNRVYLLVALIGSIAFPLINLSVFQQAATLPSLADVIPTYWLPEVVIGGTVIENESFSGWQIAFSIYVVGISLLLLRLLMQLVNLLRYIQQAQVKLVNDTYVLEVADDKPTFSFFKYIFIGQSHLLSEEEKKDILEHERVHATRYHSLDILLVNVLGILFWFNPIIYFYKKTLVQLHEFEADSRAVADKEVNQYCSLLARVALHSAEFPIANHFNNSLTLKRIAMIKTIKHSISNWKKALLPLIVVLLFMAIACEDQVMSDIKEVAKTSSITTDYPQEVKKAVDEIKAKNKSAEVLVMGVIPGDNTALENLDKQMKADQIRSVHIIKPTQSSGTYESYIIIEKGEQLNSLAELSSTDDRVFTLVEQHPEFPGGLPALREFLSTNIRYPEVARNAGVQGTTFVQFIVSEDGSISDVSIIKGVSPECDAEAMRVVGLSPKWIPGKQSGQNVKVRFVLPIKFATGTSTETSVPKPMVVEKKMKVSVNVENAGNGKLVTGYVKDESDKPLSGVNVVVQNTTQGTVTKSDGSFSIQPNQASGKLIASYIGYRFESIAF
jgi:TonB family protein